MQTMTAIFEDGVLKPAQALNFPEHTQVRIAVEPLQPDGQKADDGADHSAPPPIGASFQDWKTKFDAWMAEVQARSPHYPPGFAMDDSRESIYEGCGE